MRVTLEATDKIVELKLPTGAVVPARIWEGETESGIACHAFITRIAVHKDLDSSQFDRELQAVKPLSKELSGVYDARLVL
jgi:hypothetical protein